MYIYMYTHNIYIYMLNICSIQTGIQVSAYIYIYKIHITCDMSFLTVYVLTLLLLSRYTSISGLSLSWYTRYMKTHTRDMQTHTRDMKTDTRARDTHPGYEDKHPGHWNDSARSPKSILLKYLRSNNWHAPTCDNQKGDMRVNFDPPSAWHSFVSHPEYSF